MARIPDVKYLIKEEKEALIDNNIYYSLMIQKKLNQILNGAK